MTLRSWFHGWSISLQPLTIHKKGRFQNWWFPQFHLHRNDTMHAWLAYNNFNILQDISKLEIFIYTMKHWILVNKNSLFRPFIVNKDKQDFFVSKKMPLVVLWSLQAGFSVLSIIFQVHGYILPDLWGCPILLPQSFSFSFWLNMPSPSYDQYSLWTFHPKETIRIIE